MRHARTVALVAGVLFISLALFIQGILPGLLPESRQRTVTRVVRTNLAELKWVWAETGDYTPLEKLGRRVYIREGCWYCHSQYVRPVTGESQRWGPVSEAGEYAFDLPHLFSTRRIGPDLTRVGLKYGDDWHHAHHWDPRLIVPDSNMPRFPWLFKGPFKVPIETTGAGERHLARTPELEAVFNFESEREILLTPSPEGLVFAEATDATPKLFLPSPEFFTGDTVQVLVATEELKGLVAYIQKLGMNRGKWRDVFEPQNLFAAQAKIPGSDELVARGREVYRQRCEGCHGVKGDGRGPASGFFQVKPRDFTLGVFKFRSTPSGAMPTDGDLLRTITNGIRGTPMPTWHELPEKDRLAVITFIKTFSEYFEEPSEPSLFIGEPPPPSPELVELGKQAYLKAKCWQCHGGPGEREGQAYDYPWGQGPSAPELEDDFGFPIEPTDFTSGTFKSGPQVADLFRTMSTGLNGTPMPSFIDQMTEEERWAISYYTLSVSAYRDPLHGTPLNLPEEVKAALDQSAVKAASAATAYRWPGLLPPEEMESLRRLARRAASEPEE